MYVTLIYIFNMARIRNRSLRWGCSGLQSLSEALCMRDGRGFGPKGCFD